jgi:hypothetical protein
MSKKQTRRSISVSGETYDRLQAYVKAKGQTGSGFIEGMLRAFFEMPERDQKEVVAPIPRFERKASIPQISMKSDMAGKPVAPIPAPPTPKAERVMVMTTPELGPETTWVEKGPADRVQAIKDVQAAKEAFEKKDEPEKKPGKPLVDMASKIFTF